MTEVQQTYSRSLLDKIRLLASSTDRNIELDKDRLYRGTRTATGFIPMIITTDYQVSRAGSGQHLLFWSGPKNTTWNFNQRGSIQQSRSGHIAHFWRDSKRSTFFDNPSVQFTFQTGNIMPIRTKGGGTLTTLPPGLVDYYDFFQFMDERKILSSGRPNFVNIVYHSLLYPTILLRGFFEPETTISVTEDASKPASIEWNATFRIKESDPPFYDSSKLMNAWYAASAPDSTLIEKDILRAEAENTAASLGVLPGRLEAEALESKERLLALAEQDRLEIEAAKLDNRNFIKFVDGD